MALRNNPSTSSSPESIKDKASLLKETKDNIQSNLNNLQKLIDKSYKKFIDLANTPTISSVRELSYHCRERNLKFPEDLKSALPKSTLDSKTGIRTYEPFKERQLTEKESLALKNGYISVLKHIKSVHDANTLESHKKVYQEEFSHTGTEIQTSPDGKRYASSPETDFSENQMYSRALATAIKQASQGLSTAEPVKPTTVQTPTEPTSNSPSKPTPSTGAPSDERKKRWSAGETDKSNSPATVDKIKNKSLDDLFNDFKKKERSATKEDMKKMYKSLLILKKSDNKIVDNPKYKTIKKWLSNFIDLDENKVSKKPSKVESPAPQPENKDSLTNNSEKITDNEIKTLIAWAKKLNLRLEEQGFTRSGGIISCKITNLNKTSSGKSEKYKLEFNKKDKTGSIKIISGDTTTTSASELDAIVGNVPGVSASLSSHGYTKKIRHDFKDIKSIQDLLGKVEKTNILEDLENKFLSQTLKDIDEKDLKLIKKFNFRLKEGDSVKEVEVKVNEKSIKKEGDELSFSLNLGKELTNISLNNKNNKVKINGKLFELSSDTNLQGLLSFIIKNSKQKKKK